jgi:hypothetical protein
MIIACAAASSTDASGGRDRLSVGGHDAIFGCAFRARACGSTDAGASPSARVQITRGLLAGEYPLHEEKFRFAAKPSKPGKPHRDKTSFMLPMPLR